MPFVICMCLVKVPISAYIKQNMFYLELGVSKYVIGFTCKQPPTLHHLFSIPAHLNIMRNLCVVCEDKGQPHIMLAPGTVCCVTASTH